MAGVDRAFSSSSAVSLAVLACKIVFFLPLDIGAIVVGGGSGPVLARGGVFSSFWVVELLN